MKINYFATLRDITRLSSERWNAPAATLEDLLRALCLKYGAEFRRWVTGEDGCLGGLSILLVNGEDYRSLHGLQTPLQAQDEISIFPPLAGG
jgi:sulfur-carrier protein